MKSEARVLERHLVAWREHGLIDAELEARMRGVSAGLAPAWSRTAVLRGLALLGGSLVLAGLVLIIAENWGIIPRWAKLGGWAALQIAFLGATEALRRRAGDRPYLAETASYLASGWALGGIALVSQIYHLSARPPNLFWLWLALVLPAVWLQRVRGPSLAVFAAVLAGLTAEVGLDSGPLHATESDGPWLWLLVPVLAAVVTVLLPRRVEALRLIVGLWFFASATVFLLVVGSGTHGLDSSHLGRAWIVAGIGLAAGLLVPTRIFPAGWPALESRLMLLATFLPWVVLGGSYGHQGYSLREEVAVVLAWVVQIGIAILLIRSGARSGAEGWVTLGYVAILAGILVRYFDFFGDFLEGGVSLLWTGILVLTLLWVLERSRRRTLRRQAS